MALSSIPDILADLSAGKMVIIMDDEDRENEGDLIMAASKVRPEDINFMTRYARGLVCLTLTRERCRQLNLPLMVSENNTTYATAFTVSIEAAQGVTTGISAADRAMTVRAAVAPGAGPENLVQPGHIFPLMAQPGGVLTRAGHTEAGCDLARLAGLEPAAVIVEILKEDGSMARRPDLERFAEEHGLKIGTIEDLIRHRLATETTVERSAACDIDTDYGPFRLTVYHDTVGGDLHYALVRGDLAPDQPALVRVHVQNRLCDILGMVHEDCGWPLRRALRRIAEAGQGVVVVLSEPQDDQELVRRVRQLQLARDQGAAGQTAAAGRPASDVAATELRTYGLGAQILADLGVHQMRVLSAPKIMHALSGFGLEVVEYLPCD